MNARIDNLDNGFIFLLSAIIASNIVLWTLLLS